MILITTTIITIIIIIIIIIIGWNPLTIPLKSYTQRLIGDSG